MNLYCFNIQSRNQSWLMFPLQLIRHGSEMITSLFYCRQFSYFAFCNTWSRTLSNVPIIGREVVLYTDILTYEYCSNRNLLIRHFHMIHFVCPPPPPPPTTIVFNFSRGMQSSQHKFKAILMQNVGGKQGVLWEMWKW